MQRLITANAIPVSPNLDIRIYGRIMVRPLFPLELLLYLKGQYFSYNQTIIVIINVPSDKCNSKVDILLVLSTICMVVTMDCMISELFLTKLYISIIRVQISSSQRLFLWRNLNRKILSIPDEMKDLM